MTLLEIANYACSKINQTDAGDILAAKNFCRRQFTLIWQSQLWKDSLIEFTQTLGVAADYVVTDTWLPTKQILLCPTILSHVIAVRNADRKFNVQSSELFYCQDFDQFQNSGTAVDYRLLAPCVWELETHRNVDISGADDVSQTTDYLDTDSVTVIRLTAAISADSSIDTERIDSVTKPVTTGNLFFTERTTGTQFLALLPADTQATKRQRLQLIGAVESGMVLRVLGKRTCPTFTADNDEPGLTGVENALMALTHADMLERERHYGQAKLIFDKAGVMMEVLVKEQTAQQAHQKRIIPSDGFGNPFGFDGLLGTKTNP